MPDGNLGFSDMVSDILARGEDQKKRKALEIQTALENALAEKRYASEAKYRNQMIEHYNRADSIDAQPKPVNYEKVEDQFGNIYYVNPNNPQDIKPLTFNGLPLKAFKNPEKPEKADVEFDRETGTFIDKTNRKTYKDPDYQPAPPKKTGQITQNEAYTKVAGDDLNKGMPVKDIGRKANEIMKLSDPNRPDTFMVDQQAAGGQSQDEIIAILKAKGYSDEEIRAAMQGQ